VATDRQNITDLQSFSKYDKQSYTLIVCDASQYWLGGRATWWPAASLQTFIALARASDTYSSLIVTTFTIMIIAVLLI
jgi:hypothetical protein